MSNTHDHHHTNGAGHALGAADFRRAFAIGIALNLAFVIVEFVFGLLGNSVALMADAGHNLSDVLGLAIAWIASALGKRPPSSRYTYGLGGSSILAALFNGDFCSSRSVQLPGKPSCGSRTPSLSQA